MNKITNFYNKIKFFLLFLLILFVLLIFLLFFQNSKHQKMPLTSSMTFNSSVKLDEINIYQNAKTSYTNYDNETITINKQDKKTSSKIDTLPITIYFIILGCSLPIIIVLIVLLIPSGKIIDNLIAYNFNKKKKEKLKLGVQNNKTYFEIDDDNL